MVKNPDEIIDGCVYKIVSLVNPEQVYFGSTNKLYIRKLHHKSEYKSYINKKLKTCYTYFEIFDLGKYTTEIVKEYKQITRRELENFETEFIQNNKCVNKKKKLTEQMKIDRKNAYDNQYREANIAIINQQYICGICDGNYSTGNKARHFTTYKHQNAVNQKLLDLENQNKQLTAEIAAIKPKIVIKLKPKTLNIQGDLNINN